MTSGLRRGARRSESDDLPPGMAAIRRNRACHLGTIPFDLLGEDRL